VSYAPYSAPIDGKRLGDYNDDDLNFARFRVSI